MKKIVLIAFTLFFVNNLYAQHSQLGIKAGINYAGFVGNDAEDKGYESQVGLLGGITATAGITERFGIRAEILYSEKGSQLDADNQKDDDIKINLKYIDVPVLLAIFAGKFTFELGPQFGYLLSAKSQDTKVTDNFRKIDIGGVAGVGYMFDNGLNAGLRYNMGITKLGDSDMINPSEFRNSAFQLTIGYMIPGRN